MTGHQGSKETHICDSIPHLAYYQVIWRYAHGLQFSIRKFGIH